MSYTNEDDIINYYINQAGSGVGSIYSGPLYVKGYGIGSWLGGLFRAVIPFIKTRGMSVGKQLLKAGTDVLSDMQENKTVRESLRSRKGTILNDLKDAVIRGKGYAKRKPYRAINERSKIIKKSYPRNKKTKRKLTRVDILGKYN